MARKKHGKRFRVSLDLIDPITGERLQPKATFDTAAEAAKWEAETRERIAEGRHRHSPSMRFSAWCDEWLESRRGEVATTTWIRYESLLRIHVKPMIGSIGTGKVTPLDIGGVFSTMRAGGSSKSTVHHAYRLVSMVLKAAEHNDVIDRSPMPRVAAPPAPRAEVDITWTIEELEAFLADVAGGPYDALMNVTAGTGMRQGEVLGLQWPSVDLDSGKIFVCRSLERTTRDGVKLKETKTERTRTIFIDPEVVDLLRAHRTAQLEDRLKFGPMWGNEWDLVFCDGAGAPLKGHTVSQYFSRRLDKLPTVRRIPFKDLRHTHATQLRQTGSDIEVVSKRLGHTSIVTTLMYYRHVDQGEDQAAVERLRSAGKRGPRGA